MEEEEAMTTTTTTTGTSTVEALTTTTSTTTTGTSTMEDRPNAYRILQTDPTIPPGSWTYKPNYNYAPCVGGNPPTVSSGSSSRGHLSANALP